MIRKILIGLLILAGIVLIFQKELFQFVGTIVAPKVSSVPVKILQVPQQVPSMPDIKFALPAPPTPQQLSFFDRILTYLDKLFGIAATATGLWLTLKDKKKKKRTPK
jgi:hypothetical protein